MNNQEGKQGIKVSIFRFDHEISAVYRGGASDLIVFLHGLGCSKESFKGAWDAEELNGISLLALDLFGFGDSDRPSGFSYSMEDQADVCRRVIDYFTEKRIHLVAHSMGGAIGLLLADLIPERLSSYISVEGNLIGEDCSILSRGVANISFKEFEEEYFSALKEGLREQPMPGLDLDRAHPEAFYKSATSLVKWSDSGRLMKLFKRLECNKSYFYGEHNSGMVVLEKLEQFQTISVEESGHFPMNENPGDFYLKLKRFLQTD